MTAKQEPLRPYLIQRGSFKDTKDSEITGFDSLICCEYMGSSEFEFGGLPQSLRRIDASFSKVALHTTPHVSHDGQALYLVCLGEPARFLAALDVVATKDRGFKESPYLRQRLSGKDWNEKPIGEHIQRVGLWWDIDHDWMAVLGEDNARRLMLALRRLHEKWAGGKAS